MEKQRFEDLQLSHEIQKAVVDMGFEETTHSIPVYSQDFGRKDIIGRAQTGTGKTAAFGIPALEMTDPKNREVQALILCPTRELAIRLRKN